MLFEVLPELAQQRVLDLVLAQCTSKRERLAELIRIAGSSRAARKACIAKYTSFSTSDCLHASVQQHAPLACAALAPTDVDSDSLRVGMPGRLASACVHRIKGASGSRFALFMAGSNATLLSASISSKSARSVDIFCGCCSSALAQLCIGPNRQSFCCIPIAEHPAWAELSRWLPNCAAAVSRPNDAFIAQQSTSPLLVQSHQQRSPRSSRSSKQCDCSRKHGFRRFADLKTKSPTDERRERRSSSSRSHFWSHKTSGSSFCTTEPEFSDQHQSAGELSDEEEITSTAPVKSDIVNGSVWFESESREWWYCYPGKPRRCSLTCCGVHMKNVEPRWSPGEYNCITIAVSSHSDMCTKCNAFLVLSAL